MADIEQSINQINNAVYGEEVRSSIVNGINAINEEAESTTRRQKNVETKQDQLNTSQTNLANRWDLQIKNITDSNPSNVEIVDGRISNVKGVTYTNLGLRLNNIEEESLSSGINAMYPPAGLTPLQKLSKNLEQYTESEIQAIAVANTDAFNALTNYIVKGAGRQGDRVLKFPAGVFPLLNNIKVEGIVNLMGSPTRMTSMEFNNIIKAGTVLYDVSPVDSRIPFIYYKPSDPVSPTQAVGLFPCWFKGIEFHGRYQKHDGLRLCKIGMEARLENIRIQCFLGRGLYADRCYDTNVNGLSIGRCGSLRDIEELDSNGNIVTDTEGNTKYISYHALEFGSEVSGDNSNAWNIFGLHIEMCLLHVKFGRCRHIKILASKFEQGYDYDRTTTGYNSILITNAAMELTFGESVFSPSGIISTDDTKPVTYIPDHFIKIENQNVTQYYRFVQCAKFVNCDFTTPGGGKFIKSEASAIIDACKFSYVYAGNALDGTPDYGIYLNGPNNIISNSSITNFIYKGIGNGIYLNGATADANTIMSIASTNNKVTEVYDYGITCTNIARVGASNYYDVTLPVRNLNSNCSIQRSGRTSVLSNAKLATMGITDLTNVSVDLNLLESLSDVLAFGLTTQATITAIKNACNGDVITILNTNSTEIKVTNSASTNGIRLNPTYDKDGILKTFISLSTYDSLQLKCMGTYFVEVSRNIQSANGTANDDDIKEELLLSLNCLSSQNLTTTKTNLFIEDTSKKNLKLKSCYNASSYRFVAPYTGYFKVQIHAYCNPSISSPDYFHSISNLLHYKTIDGSASLIQTIPLTRISTYGGMAGYAIATRVVYMEKTEFFEIFADGHNGNTYSAVYQNIQINVTGIKEIS